MWGEIDCPTPAVLPNSSEKLGNNESAIRGLTDNSRCGRTMYWKRTHLPCCCITINSFLIIRGSRPRPDDVSTYNHEE